METNKSVKRMDDLLKRKGKTRTWAAEQIHISISTVSRWFSRGSTPIHVVLDRLNQLNNRLEKMEDAKDE